MIQQSLNMCRYSSKSLSDGVVFEPVLLKQQDTSDGADFELMLLQQQETK